jgi:hypothetical protein
MKKLLSSLFIVFCLLDYHSSVAQVNVYHPFPDSNAVWCDSVGLNQAHTFYCGILNYTLAGDTIVNGIIYHQLNKQEQSFLVNNSWCYPNMPNPFDKGYVGAIRQDVVHRKVYFLAPSSKVDSLLYDFSLNVGDTLRTYIAQVCLSPVIVTSIDSVLIGSNYRKRWTINESGCMTMGEIIEGIGSTFGLLYIMVSYGSNAEGAGEAVSNLYCFSQNNQSLYPNYIDRNI